MLGLFIKDEIRWHEQWSSEFDNRFRIHDSSYNLIIFEDEHTREDILAVLGKAHEDLYELFEVEDAPSDQCDYTATSGRCFNRKDVELPPREVRPEFKNEDIQRRQNTVIFENVDVQEAIKRSIQTEKNARDFYRLAARHMKNQQARKIFELLASEEQDHAKMFYEIYQGGDLPDFTTYMALDPAQDSDWLSDLERELMEELNERRAMELAMDKELKLEKALRAMAEKISSESVREVFVKNAESTHQHYELIESEYAHLMGMVHETDIDTYVRE